MRPGYCGAVFLTELTRGSPLHRMCCIRVFLLSREKYANESLLAADSGGVFFKNFTLWPAAVSFDTAELQARLTGGCRGNDGSSPRTPITRRSFVGTSRQGIPRHEESTFWGCADITARQKSSMSLKLFVSGPAEGRNPGEPARLGVVCPPYGILADEGLNP